ncbi:MAG: hypothetical protein ACRDPY_40470 [Streptosporangiaceae bacterium]
MFQPIRNDPEAGQVRRITFVPFLADGRCVLIEGPGGPELPVAEVHDDEDYRDAVLRIRPGTGRLLVSDYAANPSAGHPTAAETLRSLGFRCAGQTSGGDRPGRPRLLRHG